MSLTNKFFYVRKTNLIFRQKNLLRSE